MKAYLGDPAIKAEYLARVEAHRVADELVQGYGYWEDGKGCAVGCTIHGNDHNRYETELGIPREIAYLEDSIFEGLPVAQAREWPGKFLSAIQPGADLSLIWNRFAEWLLVDEVDGCIKFAKGDSACERAILAVADLHRRAVNGDAAGPLVWAAAQTSAGAAARAATREAVGAAVGAAARAASWEASWEASGAAAWAAAQASAGAASGAATRIRQSEKLLELLAAMQPVRPSR